MTRKLDMADDSNQKSSEVKETSLVVAKNAKEVVEFKKPFPVDKKKKKMKVLDDDTYLQEIDRIIQRDFFPDLEKLKTQNAYLEAVRTHNVNELQRIYARYSVRDTPFSVQDSCRTSFETPQNEAPFYQASERPSLATESVVSKNEETVAKGPTQSLDSFLSMHTSVDNQNFSELLEHQEKIRREKHPWMFREDTDYSTNLEIPAIENKKDDIKNKEKPNTLDTWKYKDRNYIMFVPDGIELSDEQKIEMAAKRQQIVRANTRLNNCPFNEQQNKEAIQHIAHMQSKINEGKIGVDGKEIVSESPRVNGFSFVRSPSPTPGVGVDESPLMTWGQIEGTPFRLDGSDTPISVISSGGPSFKIAEPARREKLAHKLAEKASLKYRNRKEKALETARRQLVSSSPYLLRSPMDKLNVLSPAAKRLISAHLHKGDTSLRSSYTPKHVASPRTPILVKPKTPVTKRKVTPVLSQSLKSSPKSDKESLEENTNKTVSTIKRPKASDFFS